jgi:predicted enzyme related to lactoylglutathione lyase
MKHAINWFEIPVKDIEKAKTFYEAILGTELGLMEMMGAKMAFLPADFEAGGVGGCLIQGEGYEPSEKGALVYLNGGDDLSIPLARVEQAGGTIILPKTDINPHGFMAHFIDTEGNRVAFHSMS